MPITLETTVGNKLVFDRAEFATTCFVCNAGGKLEATIQKGTSITGNGSTANPLAIRVSADVGNSAQFGTDGGVFVPSAASGAFTLAGNAGPSQTISSGDTLTINGDGVDGRIRTTTSATDAIEVRLDITGATNNHILTKTALGYNWQAPASQSFVASDGVTTQTVSNGQTLTFNGTGLATATVSATRQVTIDVEIPTYADECPSGYFVGAPV